MKKTNVLFAVVFTLLMVLSSCTNGNIANSAQISSEKTKAGSALVLTQAYNDTLKMVYDTVKIHKNNSYCIKYDKLYHKNDSMFTVHYHMFGDEMYKNGVMMTNYTPGSGMMQGGGMMDNGSSDYKQMMSDTATVGGYYRNMMKLHTAHQVYHNGIYN